jgi:hypothetical protein
MMLKHTSKMAAVALSAALVARLGWPALSVMAFLVVLAAGLACWVISDDDRSKRVTRMLAAWRGGTTSPKPDIPAISPPATHRLRRWGKR